MGRITREQYNHIIKMRKAGASLEDIQAYTAKCMLPDAYHGKKKKRKKRMRN